MRLDDVKNLHVKGGYGFNTNTEGSRSSLSLACEHASLAKLAILADNVNMNF